MSEKALLAYKTLRKERKVTNKSSQLISFSAVTLFFLFLIFFIVPSLIAEDPDVEPTVYYGLVIGIYLIFVLCSVLTFRLGCRRSLKKTIKTLERTGSIEYIDEIIEKRYQTDGTVCLSKHILYIPGRMLFAYSDIKSISCDCENYTHFISTSDDKRYNVSIDKSILEELAYRQGHIEVLSI